MRTVLSDLYPEPGGSADEVQATASLPSTSGLHRLSTVRTTTSVTDKPSLGSRSVSFIRSGVNAVSSLFAGPRRSGEVQRSKSVSSPKGKRRAARPARPRPGRGVETQTQTQTETSSLTMSTVSDGDSPRQPSSRETVFTATETRPGQQPELATDSQAARQPDQTPDQLPDHPPDQLPNQLPNQLPDQPPNQLPDQPPNHPPDQLPDQPPNHPPDQLPDQPPDQLPDQPPDEPPQPSPVKESSEGRGRRGPGAEDLDSEGRSMVSESDSHTDTEPADAEHDERASLASEPFSSSLDGDDASQQGFSGFASSSAASDVEEAVGEDDAQLALSPRSSRRVTFDENAPETLLFTPEPTGQGRGSDDEAGAATAAGGSADSDGEEAPGDSFQQLLELLRERSLTPTEELTDRGESSGQPTSHVARYLRDLESRRHSREPDTSDIQDDEEPPHREERRFAFPSEAAPDQRRGSFVETIDTFLHYLQAIAEDHKAHQEALVMLDEEPLSADGVSDAASDGDSAWSETSEPADSASEPGSIETDVDSGLATSPRPPPLDTLPGGGVAEDSAADTRSQHDGKVPEPASSGVAAERDTTPEGSREEERPQPDPQYDAQELSQEAGHEMSQSAAQQQPPESDGTRDPGDIHGDQPPQKNGTLHMTQEEHSPESETNSDTDTQENVPEENDQNVNIDRPDEIEYHSTGGPYGSRPVHDPEPDHSTGGPYVSSPVHNPQPDHATANNTPQNNAPPHTAPDSLTTDTALPSAVPPTDQPAAEESGGFSSEGDSSDRPDRGSTDAEDDHQSEEPGEVPLDQTASSETIRAGSDDERGSSPPPAGAVPTEHPESHDTADPASPAHVAVLPPAGAAPTEHPESHDTADPASPADVAVPPPAGAVPTEHLESHDTADPASPADVAVPPPAASTDHSGNVSRESSAGAADSRRGSAILRGLLRSSLPAVEVLGSHSDSDTLPERRASAAAGGPGSLLSVPAADLQAHSPGQVGSLEAVSKSPGELSQLSSGASSETPSESELSRHAPVRSLASIADRLLRGDSEEEAPRAVPSGVGPANSLMAISGQLLTDRSPGEPADPAEPAAGDEADTEHELHSIIMDGGTEAEVETGEAEVEVAAGEPEAEVEAGEAEVEVEAGDAEAEVETGEAGAEVETGEAKADVEAGEAEVEVETGEAEAEAEVETGEAEEKVGTGEAEVDVETGEAEAEVETGEAKAKVETGEAEVEVETGEAEAEAEVETGEADAKVGTGEAEVDVETGEVEAEVETGEAEAEVEAGEAEVEVETGEAESEVETGEAEAKVETGEAEAEVETGEAEAKVETEEAEAEVETGEAGAEVETGEAEAEVETGDAEVDVEAGEAKAEVDTGDAEEEAETGDAEAEVATGGQAAKVETGMPAAGMETGGQAEESGTSEPAAGTDASQQIGEVGTEDHTDNGEAATSEETKTSEDDPGVTPDHGRGEQPQALTVTGINDKLGSDMQPEAVNEVSNDEVSVLEKEDEEADERSRTEISKLSEGSASMTDGEPNIGTQTSARLELEEDELGSVTSEISEQAPKENYSESTTNENEMESTSEQPGTNEATNDTVNTSVEVESTVDDQNAHQEALALLDSEATDSSALPDTARTHTRQEEVMSGTRKTDDPIEGMVEEGTEPDSATSAGGTDEPRESDSRSSVFSDLRSEVSEYTTGSEMDPDEHHDKRIRLTSDGESATTFDDEEVYEQETTTSLRNLPNRSSARKLVWSLITMASGIVQQVQGSEIRISASKIGFPLTVEEQRKHSQAGQENASNDNKNISDAREAAEILPPSDKSMSQVVYDEITKEAERNSISVENLKEIHGSKIKEIIRQAQSQIIVAAQSLIDSVLKQTSDGKLIAAQVHENVNSEKGHKSSEVLQTQPNREDNILTQNNETPILDQNLPVDLGNEDTQDGTPDNYKEDVVTQTSNVTADSKSSSFGKPIYAVNREQDNLEKSTSEQSKDDLIESYTPSPKDIANIASAITNYVLEEASRIADDEELSARLLRVRASISHREGDRTGSKLKGLQTSSSQGDMDEESDLTSEQNQDSETPVDSEDFEELSPDDNQEPEAPSQENEEEAADAEASQDAVSADAMPADGEVAAPMDDIGETDAGEHQTEDLDPAEPATDDQNYPSDEMDGAPADPQEPTDTGEQLDEPSDFAQPDAEPEEAAKADEEPPPLSAEEDEPPLSGSFSESVESADVMDEGLDTMDATRIRYEMGEIADQTQNVVSTEPITSDMLNAEPEEGAVTVGTEVAGETAEDEQPPPEDREPQDITGDQPYMTYDADDEQQPQEDREPQDIAGDQPDMTTDADDAFGEDVLASDSMLGQDKHDDEPADMMEQEASTDGMYASNLDIDDGIKVSILHADSQDDPIHPVLAESIQSSGLLPPMSLKRQSSWLEKDIVAPDLLAMKKYGSSKQEMADFADKSASDFRGQESAFEPDADLDMVTTDDVEKVGDADAADILAAYEQDLDLEDLESSGETETAESESSSGSQETIKDDDAAASKDDNVFDWLRRVSTQMDEMGITEQLKEMYGDDPKKPVMMQQDDGQAGQVDATSPKTAYSDTGMYHDSSLSLDQTYCMRQSSTQTDVKEDGLAAGPGADRKGRPGGGRRAPCGSCPCCVAMKRVVSGGEAKVAAGGGRRRPQQQQQQQRPWTSPTRSVGDLLDDASSATVSSCTASSEDGGDAYQRRMKHPKKWLKQATDEFMRRECIRQVVLKNDLVSDGRIRTKVTRISRHPSSLTDCLAACGGRAPPVQSLQMEISRGETVVGGRTVNYQDVKIRTPQSCGGTAARSVPHARRASPGRATPQDGDPTTRFIDTYLAKSQAGSQSGRTSRNGRETKTRKKITIKTDCRM